MEESRRGLESQAGRETSSHLHLDLSTVEIVNRGQLGLLTINEQLV